MTAYKRLLSIVAIVCLCSMTANALSISVSIGKHSHDHARKTVVLGAYHRAHCGPTVVHAPHARMRIFAPIGTRSYVTRPIGHRPFRWQHPHPVVRRPCTKRRILLAPPKHVVRRPACVSILTIWITNSNGSKTPVKLQRKGHGYVGPKGEYYPCRPTHRQLHMIYGF